MSELMNGTSVQLDGLVNAKQHNGKTGFIVGFDEESGRYAIALEGESNSILNVKSQNIAVLSPADKDTEAYAEAVGQAVETGHGSATTQDANSAALIALLQEQMRNEREARERSEARMNAHLNEREKTARAQSRNNAARDCCCCLGATTAVVGTAVGTAVVAGITASSIQNQNRPSTLEYMNRR